MSQHQPDRQAAVRHGDPPPAVSTAGPATRALSPSGTSAAEPTVTGLSATGKPSLSSHWLRRYRYPVISTLSVVVVLAAWQFCASTGIVQANLTSSPWGVVQAAEYLVGNNELGSAVASSSVLFGVGLGIAICLGAVGGIVIGWWRFMGAVFEPFVAILYAMPLIALLPVLLVWFGITFRAQVIMVLLISVFPILVSVMTGTRNVDVELIKLAKSFKGKERAILRTVVLPSIVPYFVSGVRLAIGSALVGMVVAEYFLGEKGIGGLIVRAGEVLQTGQVFVGVVILAIAALILTSLLRMVERRFSKWRG